ncbi:MAG: hypothetical protein ABIG37_02235 [Nanoarchaeota archaeon]|nr:hypothetical protein [Nanoarchaeota archaeon]
MEAKEYIKRLQTEKNPYNLGIYNNHQIDFSENYGSLRDKIGNIPGMKIEDEETTIEFKRGLESIIVKKRVHNQKERCNVVICDKNSKVRSSDGRYKLCDESSELMEELAGESELGEINESIVRYRNPEISVSEDFNGICEKLRAKFRFDKETFEGKTLFYAHEGASSLKLQPSQDGESFGMFCVDTKNLEDYAHSLYEILIYCSEKGISFKLHLNSTAKRLADQMDPEIQRHIDEKIPIKHNSS